MSLIAEYQRELERLMTGTDDTVRLRELQRIFDEEEEGREEEEGLFHNSSKYAVVYKNNYNKSNRTAPVFGLVIHTTGSGAPAAAHNEGIPVLEWCARHYSKTYGCHYVNGYKGAEGGELLLVGTEDEKAWTVGVVDQSKATRAGRWQREISATTLKHWEKNWGDRFTTPNDLFPGNSVNNVYVGLEMPPVHWWNRETTVVTAEPMRDGLLFTRAQHDTVILLAIDIAERHGFPDGWWISPRLLGHEDLSPINRSKKHGGWDPGWLREKPYFDFGYVRDEIIRLIG